MTVLPALILILDKPLQKTKHKALIPNMGKFAKDIVKVFSVFLVIFALLVPPAYYGYSKTNDEVYHDMGQCLPEDMEYVIANSKLAEDFNIASTHMLLIDTDLPTKNVRKMIGEMEQVDGVKYVLGLESVVGSSMPEEILPNSVVEILKSDKWELMLINSEYKVASDEVNEQITQLNAILKRYDEGGMLIGEAPCMKTAGFRVLKTLDEFVWNSAIELSSGLTQEYMTDLHFLTPKENLIFMGTVGTGKTQAESYSQKPTIIHRIRCQKYIISNNGD